MEPYNKLVLYLGQQYKTFKRDVIFEDEFIQLFYPDTSTMHQILSGFAKEGFLDVVGEKLYKVKEPLIKQFEYLDPGVFVSGQLGGGQIGLDRSKPIFTILVEFDSTAKFLGNYQKKYNGSTLNFLCLPDKNYIAKAHCSIESGLLVEEESIIRYLSRLSYCFNIPVFIRSTHSATHDFSTNTITNPRPGIILPLPDFSELELRQHQVLAFYRQYVNFSGLETREAYYYQLLSLVKILEGIHPTRIGQKEVVVDAIEKERLKLDRDYQDRLSRLEQKLITKRNKNFSDTIWEYYRHGVSHWREEGFLDPDVPDDDLGSVLNILFKIVRNILKTEYKL